MLTPVLLSLLSSVRGWTIDVPSSAPDDAIGPIDPQFQSFAFEIASFAQYAQTNANDSSPNQYTLAMMDEIVSRTGGHPVIRIGGTSADYAHYSPGMQDPIVPVAEINNLQLINFTVLGPSFWDLTHNFESLGAKFIIQVPMATTNISEPVAWASAAIPRVGWENIEAIQIGNEPNLYGNQKTRYPNASSPTGATQGPVLTPPGWQAKFSSNQSYADMFKQYATAIMRAVNISDDQEPIFQAGELSGGTGQAYLDGVVLFEDGLDDGDYINAFTGHLYQTPTGNYTRVGIDLMNHTAIVNKMQQYEATIKYLSGTPKGAKNPIPFYMDEVGNSLDNPQVPQYQAVLGSALWQVDYQFHCMTIGVARINWQQIMRAIYGMWLPRESAGVPPQTYAAFYAMPIVGEFIGKGGKTKMSQLWISGMESYENTVAYMAYDDGTTPARLAIVNLNEWGRVNSSFPDPGPRPAPVFELNGLPAGSHTVKVLTSPEGAHANASTITYGGSQWTYESGGREMPVKNDTMTLEVDSSGTTSVTVEDSSAVLIFFNQ